MTSCECHPGDTLAAAFAHGSQRELAEALVCHIAESIEVRGGELVTPELAQERARNAVGGFLDLIVR